MGFLTETFGLQSLLLPAQTSIIHRSFSKKRYEHERDDQFDVAASLDLLSLTQQEFVTEIEKVTRSFPVLHSNNSFRTSASKNYPLVARFFYVKVVADADSCVFVLVDKYDCSVAAIRNGDSVLFVRGESEEYKEAADLIVAKDGVDAKKVTFQSFGLQSEYLSYSRDEMISSVISLGQGYDERKYDFFRRNISRLQGFVHCAVFPEWNAFMGRIFFESGLTVTPSSRMREVVKKWTPLSQFVLTDGNTNVVISCVPVTLKDVSGFLSVVNGRAVLNSGAGDYEDNPWDGKKHSARKMNYGSSGASAGHAAVLMRSAGCVMMKGAGGVMMRGAGAMMISIGAGRLFQGGAGGGMLHGRKVFKMVLGGLFQG